MNFKGAGHSPFSTSDDVRQAATQKTIPQSQLLELVTLALAAFLARKGELRQAEVLLLPLANEPKSQIDTLDLLAKVYAQQGKIEEARALWLRALQKEPSNTHFLRALLNCADVQPVGFLEKHITKLVIGLSIIYIAAIIVILVFAYT